jgi:hypothetical protein
MTADQDTPLPEPIDYSKAFELRKSFCEALGFDPNGVTRIEFNLYEIHVWTYDKATRNARQLVMDTRNKTTKPWTVKRSTYSHATTVKGQQ